MVWRVLSSLTTLPSMSDAMSFQFPLKTSVSLSKLLGFPTSMALESVGIDARGSNRPLPR